MSAALLKKISAPLEKTYGGLPRLEEDDPLDQLILLILSKGTDAKKARQALESLHREFVDWNEIRVTSTHEVDAAITVLGAKGRAGKAALIREILATVYSRYNRVSLDFLLDRGDKNFARNRDRLFTYLADKSSAIPAVFAGYVNGGKSSVQVSGGLPRLLTRVGILKKGGTPAQAKKLIEASLDEEEIALFLWGAYHVSDECCHRTLPDCISCVLQPDCKAAPEEMKKVKAAEKKEKERLAKEAAREAARIAAEEKARKKREERERKAIEAAEKKKEAARRKVEEKKKADAKKKAAAKKKAEAKKRADAKKKAASKKKAATKKTSKKAATKKSTTKKSTAKKTTKKKAAAKKTSKKKVAKKTAKKAAAKKTAKKASKKAPAKKAAKKAAAKKTTKKKAAAKKVAKKASKKKAAKKKTTKKPGRRR